MSNNNETDSLLNFLREVFSLHTWQGRVFFIILGTVFAAFYFKLCTLPSSSGQNSCNDRVTLIGTLLDAKTRKVLENVTVHLGTFAEDASLVGGQFTVEGVTLPESKIVPLTVEFADGKRVDVKEFDLNNSTKYPVRNCIIDLREILVLVDTTISKNNGETGQTNGPSSGPTKPITPTPNGPTIIADPSRPENVPSSTSFFNDEKQSDIAILATGQSGISIANLKNRLVQQFESTGLLATTSLFRPAFLSSFSRNLNNEDLAALKNSGLDKRTACLCFVQAGKVDFKKNKIEAGGESYEAENAHGSLEVKFFAFRSNVVRSFTIEETGAGGNQSRARESLEEKFILQFSNKKLPFQLCKN